MHWVYGVCSWCGVLNDHKTQSSATGSNLMSKFEDDFATDVQTFVLTLAPSPFVSHDKILNILLFGNYLLLHVGHPR
jgi:hypothetical protein